MLDIRRCIGIYLHRFCRHSSPVPCGDTLSPGEGLLQVYFIKYGSSSTISVGSIPY